MIFLYIFTHFWVPILQSPGEPERAGEARRADSASVDKESVTNNLFGVPVYLHPLDVYGEPKEVS